jgi:hypothetical protein
MQHLMVADGKANASCGEPQDKMMAAQREAEAMALMIALAKRFRSRFRNGVRGVTSTHAFFISMRDSRSRLAPRINKP